MNCSYPGASARNRRAMRALWAVPLTLAAIAGPAIARQVPFGPDVAVSTNVPGARAVAYGDLNGDGRVDIVGGGSEFFQRGVLWLENRGGEIPTFLERTISNSQVVARRPRSIAVGDIDGDGSNDVVAAAEFGLDLYINSGAGTPTWSWQILANGDFASVRVLDFDGDLDLDLVLAQRDQNIIAWYENQTSDFEVSFEIRVVSTNALGARSVDAADLDGDGDIDIVSASQGDNKIAWYENDGADPPGFTERVLTGPGVLDGFHDLPMSVIAVDLNGDDRVDIATASFNDDKIAWWENIPGSPPTFLPRVISEDPDGPTIVDGNGLVVSGEQQGFSDGPVELRAGDIDGSGTVDLMAGSEKDDQVAWYDNDGASPPTFVGRVVSQDPDGPEFFENTFANIDLDTPEMEEVLLLRGAKEGQVDRVASLAATDLDGDGDIDLMTASTGDRKIAWHENRLCGRAFPISSEPVSDGLAEGAASVFPIDIDGDGDIDILSASSEDDTVAWYENGGSTMPTFTQRVVDDFLRAPQSVHAADLDGDDDIDIVSASPVRISATEGAEVVWYANDGGSPPGFTKNVLTDTLLGPRGVFAADIDGDGDNDVAVTSSAENLVAWFENLGGSPPEFIFRVVTREARGAWTVTAADVDGDGNTDLLSASIGDGQIIWYANDGATPPGFVANELTTRVEGLVAASSDDPGFPAADPSIIGDRLIFRRADLDGLGIVMAAQANGALSVSTGDFDGNGGLDVIAVSAFDDKITVWENDGADVPLFTEKIVNEDPDGPLEFGFNLIPGGGISNPGGDLYVQAISGGRLDGANDGASWVSVADLDQDGDPDFSLTGVISNTVAWYETVIERREDGTVRANHFRRPVNNVADGSRSVVVADINGDGFPDMSSASYRSATIDWYLGAVDDPCVQFDVNGDGRLDGTELAWLGRAFGAEQSAADDGVDPWWEKVDFSVDAAVDGVDLSMLGSSGVWGETVFTCALTCTQP